MTTDSNLRFPNPTKDFLKWNCAEIIELLSRVVVAFASHSELGVRIIILMVYCEHVDGRVCTDFLFSKLFPDCNLISYYYR